MADCELLSKCLFFNDQLANMPDMADLMKDKYCRGDNSTCARNKVFSALGTDKVPRDLYPRDIKKADQIIVLKHGRVIEMGNEHQLLHNKGEYYRDED